MTPCQTFIAYRLPDDLGPCLMAAAWRAFDWRMALSAHDALLVGLALAAVEAFGVVSLVLTVVYCGARWPH